MATSTPNDRLTALPVEVLLQVLTSLPVKELCRCRRASKRLKVVVDAYQQSLLEPVIAFHQERLTSCCDDVLDNTNVDFISALARFVSNYGVIEDRAAGMDVLMSFCQHYARQNYPDLEEYHREALERYALFQVARRCVQGISAATLFPDSVIIRDEIISLHLESHARLIGDQSLLTLDSAWRKVCISNSSNPGKYSGVPNLFLTRRISHSQPGRYWAPFDYIPDYLGVPQLPSGGLFGYCLKTPALCARIQRKTYKGRKSPFLFEKAAILEELFIW